MAEYAYPDVLVSTAWVAEHRHDPHVRVVESDEDILLYDIGHIPGAIKVDWQSELQHQVVRDYIDKDAFGRLIGSKGIGQDQTVVFYGDRNNWWACYAFWVFKMYGHRDCRIMNGGRQKWLDEDREMTPERPMYAAVTYTASGPDCVSAPSVRRCWHTCKRTNRSLMCARPGSTAVNCYTCRITLRKGRYAGGHIPGAASVPWGQAVAPDGTFKSTDELRALYEGKAGLTPTDEVIAYCRIGERSSHTWFVLTYLLGYPSVRNYDGSWTEWGNLVGAPIERSV